MAQMVAIYYECSDISQNKNNSEAIRVGAIEKSKIIDNLVNFLKNYKENNNE